MNVVAQVSVALAALTLIVVFPLEAFLIHRPGVQRILANEPRNIDDVHLWSFCIGARNALVGGGALVGLGMWRWGEESTGTAVVVVCTIYMLLASLFMGVADLLGFWRPRGGSVRGTIGSSILPAVALMAIAV